ncbi:unnamed protein product [Rotaria sp. Silwood1]|nr:unnamed protein product [Rotaria sp. Silwood1]CAF0842175.1 unnamed protein product [Rotaria sp. Silwood1]CAF3433238.1 unnamed protein product [Rotaria sp. Silwood1]
MAFPSNTNIINVMKPSWITIPTELIGSLPRTTALLEGQQAYKAGHISENQLEKLQDKAIRQTIAELEKTGPGQITDGEQAKPSFLVYPYVHEYHTILGRWRLRRNDDDDEHQVSTTSNDDIFQFFDINHDHHISYNEFLQRMMFNKEN